MVCKQCGKELPEGTVFCDACGMKVEEPVVAPAAPAVVVPEVAAAVVKKASKFAPIMSVIAFVLALVVAITVFAPMVSFDGAVGAAKKVAKFDAKDDFAKYWGMAPDFVVDKALEEADVEDLAELEEKYLDSEVMKKYDPEEDAAKKFKVKEFEVVGVYDENDLEDWIDAQVDAEVYKKADIEEISAIKTVEVIYFADGNRDGGHYTMVKIGGKWYSWDVIEELMTAATIVKMENDK